MAQPKENPSTVILITREGMGSADHDLQQRLLKSYLRLLIDSETLPNAICFYTDGVKLLVEGSPVLEELRALEAREVHLIACSTCLNYFGLVDQVQVGIVGGMADIIEAQRRADKVITL